MTFCVGLLPLTSKWSISFFFLSFLFLLNFCQQFLFLTHISLFLFISLNKSNKRKKRGFFCVVFAPKTKTSKKSKENKRMFGLVNVLFGFSAKTKQKQKKRKKRENNPCLSAAENSLRGLFFVFCFCDYFHFV